MNKSFKSAECPICFENFPDQIFLCHTGHSFCGSCRKTLVVCPVCKELMTHQRNYTLESVIKELKTYLNNDAKFIRMCPFKECEYKDADKNEILSHLVVIHKNKVLVCDSELFSMKIRKTNSDKYFSQILIYKKNIFILWTKINRDHKVIYFTVQMVDYTEKCSFMFEVDYIKCVRKQFTAKVSAVTTPEKVFKKGASYVVLPKHLLGENKDLVIYGRIRDNKIKINLF